MILPILSKIAVFIGITVLSFFIISFTPVMGSNSVNIYPPGNKPYGLPYAEHIENFWKWLLLIPEKENPVNDPTGENCAKGQSNSNSSVFYLVNGGIPQRICKVPAGKGLFIPIMQVELSDKESPGSSIDDLHIATKKDQDRVLEPGGTLYLKIDDKEFKKENLTKYRTPTDSFDVVYANNSIFGVTEGGVSKAVADGFYVITEPLIKGNYTIFIKSGQAQCGPDDPTCPAPFAQEIKYIIIAE